MKELCANLSCFSFSGNYEAKRPREKVLKMFRRIPPVTAPPGGVPPGSGGSRIFWQVPQTGLSGNVCLFLLRIPLLFVMDRVLLGE